MTDQNYEGNQNPKQEGEQQPYTPPPMPQQEAQAQTPPPTQQPMYQGQPNYSEQSNYGGMPPQDMPETYMTLSVVACVLGWLTCCASSCIGGIIGIVAIVFSSQVTSKYAMGDMRGAKSSSETAKILMIVSFVITGLSFLASILYFVYYMKIFTDAGFQDALSIYQDALDQAR